MMRRLLLLIGGALAALLATELLLQALPAPSATLLGRYVDPYITTYPPGHAFRSATGWSFLNAHRQRANAHGFIPDRPFDPAPGAVALIGDSLVEQSMLPVEQRLATILETSQGGIPVFSMGLGGTSLFDYLERLRYARDKLGVEAAWIVVERTDIRQSLCGTGVYTDACLDTRGQIIRIEKTPRSPLRDLLARSASLQYFVGVLRTSPDSLLGMFRRNTPEKNPASPTEREARAFSTLSDMEAMVIGRFIEELRTINIRIGLILDPEIRSLNRQRPFDDTGLLAMYEKARSARIPVAHPHVALLSHATQTGLDMRVGPYDAHWNLYANCVIAAEVLQTIAGRKGSSLSLPVECATPR